MNPITDHLIELSDRLDKAGKTKCADAVDDLNHNRSLHKFAQYVSVIGYVLKQNRAMGNCIRKKRVASDSSMQEVVLECLSEYQDGQQYGADNDWTTKYATAMQDTIVQGCPEDFEAFPADFIKIIASENQIEKHMNQIKKTCSLLKEHEIGDEVFQYAMKDIDSLTALMGRKEGDSVQRPFRVAAPPSPRNAWDRLWTSTWSGKKGKDADTRFEMDKILEGLMEIRQGTQQIQAEISRLQYDMRTSQDQNLIANINGLSGNDWRKTRAYMQNIEAIIGTPETENLNVVIEKIDASISKIQEHVNNLRYRDAIRGAGQTQSAVQEYENLTQALTKLYSNPLDPKAMYYSQTLHGQLEDALNLRTSQQSPGFADWADQPEQQPQVFPTATEEQAKPTSPENTSGSIADALSQMMDNNALGQISIFLGGLLQENTGSATLESYKQLQALKQEIDSRTRIASSNKYLKKSWLYLDKKTNIDTLIKVCQAVEAIDSEIADTLRNYLDDHQEEETCDFPEFASILKDEVSV